MIVQCCQCKKVRKGNRWVKASGSELVGRCVSHGYCPTCAARVFAQIQALLSSKELASKTA